MRILQVHTGYRQRGGEDTVVDAEARLLRKSGHQVRQMFAENPDRNLSAAANLLVSSMNPIAMRRVAKVVDDFSPDLAHVHNTWFALSAGVIRVLGHIGVPVVMTLHNYRLTCANALLYREGGPCELCVGSRPWHAVRYACYRDSRIQSLAAAFSIDLHNRIGTWTNSVDRFIVLTAFQRDLMIRAGLPEQKISIKPNFVDDPGPRLAPPSKSDLVVYVGRLTKEKGIELLVDSWKATRTDGLRLALAGDGPMAEEINRSANSSVTLLGAVPRQKVQSLMLTARAGIIPSKSYEGLPTAGIELMAAGTGIIGTNHGGIGSLLKGFDSRWSVAPTVPALSDALLSLTQGDLCDQQGSDARARYESTFTPDVSLAELMDIYSSVLRTRRMPTARD